MGVTAHLPVRLRIDAEALGDDGRAALREALRAAVGRSLGKLDSEILAPRGGYARPRFVAPTFQWGGAAIDPAEQKLLEQAVAEELAALTAPLSTAASARLTGLPPVMPPDISELFDPARNNGATYLIHSYQGPRRAPDANVPVSGGSGVRSTTSSEHYGWWRFNASDGSGYRLKAQETIFQYYLENGSVPSRLGLMCMSTDGREFYLTILEDLSVTEEAGGILRLASWRLASDISFPTALTRVGANEERSGVTRSERRGFSAEHVLTIERLALYSGRSGFRGNYASHLFSFFSIGETATPGEPATAVAMRRAINEVADQVAGAMPDRAGAFCRISSASAGAVINLSQSVMTTPYLTVLPMSVRIASDPAAEGEGLGGEGSEGAEGSGGAGGEARGGGPGGSGEPATEPFHYPAGPNGETIELDLGPFLGEPSLDQLGDLGDMLRRLIRRIAYRLDMPEGQYCGAFLIAAAQVLGGRAGGIAEAAEFVPRSTNPAPSGGGNLGAMNMEPEITPAVRLMRYLAGTSPLISELTRLMSDVYQIPSVNRQIDSYRRSDWAGWMLEFHKEHTPLMEQAVASLFIRTCSVMMLQLLRHSAQEINNRLTRFDQYFPLVEGLINRLVAGEAELIELRDILVSETQFDSFSGFVTARASDWRGARQALTMTLSTMVLNLAADSAASNPIMSSMRGQVRRENGVAQVNDGRGRWWTRDELERDIAMRHDTATSIDPLIHQLVNIPDVALVFRTSPGGSRAYLRRLLREMRDSNADVLRQVKGDPMFAFRSGRIAEDLPNATVSGCSVVMQGIHLMAHQAIGDAFLGDGWYGAGLDRAFSRELGRQTLLAVFETVVVIVVAVVCPPLGIALGVAIAGVHMYQANERMGMYSAFIEPELLFSRAELEFEMFLAQFEMVLSVIPDLGPILRGTIGSGRAIARGGTAALTRYMRRQLMVSVGRQLQAGLVRGVVTAVFIDRGMSLILPRILGPVMEDVQREITVLSGGHVSSGDGSPPASGSASGPGDDFDPANPTDPERLMSMPDVPAGFGPYDPSEEPSWVSEGMSPEEAELVRRLQEFEQGERDERLPPASEAP